MEIILTSIIAFVSTNIDDIFILTLFYGNKRFSKSEILIGQLLGITILILISLVGSLIGLVVDQAYIGFLGLVPIALGIKGLWELLSKRGETHEVIDRKGKSKHKVLTVAGVTIANGGDNIGIYIPLFAALSWNNKITMSIIFLVLTFFWCWLAQYFLKHPTVASVTDKYGHWITPFVLMLLGIFILHESGSMRLVRP